MLFFIGDSKYKGLQNVDVANKKKALGICPLQLW
jgi:hypothetical protein